MSTHGHVAMHNRAPEILVVVGGERGAPAWVPPAPGPETLVVAADSGLDAAVGGGLPVHHAVGDFDSVDPGTLRRAEASGTRVHRHAADKDATDLELALDLVLDLLGPDHGGPGARPALVIVGPGGGRLDHLMGDLLAVAAPRLAGLDVTARFGPATATVVGGGHTRVVTGPPGDQVSILPVHGTAWSVSTAGLRWALEAADLTPGTTRGISNELVAPTATVSVEAGTVLVLQPGTRAADVAPRATRYDPSPRVDPGAGPPPEDPARGSTGRPRRTEP